MIPEEPTDAPGTAVQQDLFDMPSEDSAPCPSEVHEAATPVAVTKESDDVSLTEHDDEAGSARQEQDSPSEITGQNPDGISEITTADSSKSGILIVIPENEQSTNAVPGGEETDQLKATVGSRSESTLAWTMTFFIFIVAFLTVIYVVHSRYLLPDPHTASDKAVQINAELEKFIIPESVAFEQLPIPERQ